MKRCCPLCLPKGPREEVRQRIGELDQKGGQPRGRWEAGTRRKPWPNLPPVWYSRPGPICPKPFAVLLINSLKGEAKKSPLQGPVGIEGEKAEKGRVLDELKSCKRLLLLTRKKHHPQPKEDKQDTGTDFDGVGRNPFPYQTAKKHSH